MQLSALASETGRFAIAQLDQVEFPAALLGFDLETETGRVFLAHLKQLLAQYVGSAATGVVIDPIYGFDGISALQVGASNSAGVAPGIAFRLEGLGHGSRRNELPRLLPNWGVEFIRNNFGVAKLELSYHPSEVQALEKKQLVAELADFCLYEQIDFLLVVRIFAPGGGQLSPAAHEAALLQTAQELGKLPGMLGFEYPGSPLAAATLSAELDIPWVLVSHHEPKAEGYDQFKARAREVLDAGAAGVIAGTVLYHELEQFRLADMSPDWPAVTRFLETTARDRIVELRRIVEEM